jgi:diadenylate cyclase
VILLEYLRTTLSNIRIVDLLEIAIVAFAYYKGYMLIRETRAKQLLKGIIMIVIITRLSSALKFYTISWILSNTLQVGLIAIVIVFQPELRKALEYIGRTTFFSFNFLESSEKTTEKIIEEIIKACAALSNQSIGALIVFELKTGLNEYIESGVRIDGDISNSLLINIFIPNTPLHDGAVIIKDQKIKAASCFLPLTDNTRLSQDVGTRHRAAIGITEKSDSIAVVISEEKGFISYSSDGRLYRDINIEELRELLKDIYKTEEKGKLIEKWRHKNEQ